MRARPKILLAKNYEEGKKYFNTYQRNIIGVLSDIRFPKSGKYGKSGIKLAKYIKSKEPYLPILMLSNREDYEKEAKKITGHFISKKSESLFKEIKEFIVNNLGFGDLILKNTKGKKIKSVSSIEELNVGNFFSEDTNALIMKAKGVIFFFSPVYISVKEFLNFSISVITYCQSHLK